MKSDTSPEALAVQIELLRKAGPLRRSTMASNLTNTVLQRSRRAIARANPHLSEWEVRLKFVEYFYGRQLAEAMRVRFQEYPS